MLIFSINARLKEAEKLREKENQKESKHKFTYTEKKMQMLNLNNVAGIKLKPFIGNRRIIKATTLV